MLVSTSMAMVIEVAGEVAYLVDGLPLPLLHRLSDDDARPPQGPEIVGVAVDDGYAPPTRRTKWGMVGVERVTRRPNAGQTAASPAVRRTAQSRATRRR